jgi:CHAD domain-containing protein
MSYKLEMNESIADGIRRIANEQVDKAINRLKNPDNDRQDAIHDARKCFKKIRAVLHLVRDEIGDDQYKQENIFYRDLGRELAPLRDSVVMVNTYQKIRAADSRFFVYPDYQSMQNKLIAEKQALERRLLDNEQRIYKVIENLKSKRNVTDWNINSNDFDAFYQGLKRVRKRRQKAIAEPTTENYHDWRKRVKYLWYHCRLFENVWKDYMQQLALQLHLLSDYLGDDHDLALLKRKLAGNNQTSLDIQGMKNYIEIKKSTLQNLSIKLGNRIYVEKPKRYTKRIKKYWSIG